MGLFYLIHPNSGAFVKSPFIQFSPLLGGGKDSGPSLDGQEDAFGDTKDAVNVGVALLGPSIAPDAVEADPNGGDGRRHGLGRRGSTDLLRDVAGQHSRCQNPPSDSQAHERAFLSPACSAHPKLARPRIQSINNLKEFHLQGGVLVPAQPEDIDMFQHQFPLLPEAAGQAGDSPAFAARPSLTAPTAHGGGAVPTGQPLPRQWKRHQACSPKRPCSREAAASFTLLLTVLAGAMQWIYCPAPRSDF
jgi:hypothetical protein